VNLTDFLSFLRALPENPYGLAGLIVYCAFCYAMARLKYKAGQGAKDIALALAPLMLGGWIAGNAGDVGGKALAHMGPVQRRCDSSADCGSGCSCHSGQCQCQAEERKPSLDGVAVDARLMERWEDRDVHVFPDHAPVRLSY
jgi:hypothetical protein